MPRLHNRDSNKNNNDNNSNNLDRNINGSNHSSNNNDELTTDKERLYRKVRNSLICQCCRIHQAIMCNYHCDHLLCQSCLDQYACCIHLKCPICKEEMTCLNGSNNILLFHNVHEPTTIIAGKRSANTLDSFDFVPSHSLSHSQPYSSRVSSTAGIGSQNEENEKLGRTTANTSDNLENLEGTYEEIHNASNTTAIISNSRMKLENEDCGRNDNFSNESANIGHDEYGDGIRSEQSNEDKIEGTYNDLQSCDIYDSSVLQTKPSRMTNGVSRINHYTTVVHDNKYESTYDYQKSFDSDKEMKCKKPEKRELINNSKSILHTQFNPPIVYGSSDDFVEGTYAEHILEGNEGEAGVLKDQNYEGVELANSFRNNTMNAVDAMIQKETMSRDTLYDEIEGTYNNELVHVDMCGEPNNKDCEEIKGRSKYSIEPKYEKDYGSLSGANLPTLSLDSTNHKVFQRNDIDRCMKNAIKTSKNRAKINFPSPPSFSLEATQCSYTEGHNYDQASSVKRCPETFPTLSLEHSEGDNSTESQGTLKTQVSREKKHLKITQIHRESGHKMFRKEKLDNRYEQDDYSMTSSNLPVESNRPIIVFQDLLLEDIVQIRQLHNDGACLVTKEIGVVAGIVNTTHFVVSCKTVPHHTDQRMVNVCMRSFNYLLALVLGLHIVSPQWIKQSVKDNEWAETEPFEIFSDEYTYRRSIESKEVSNNLGVCRRSRILYKSNVVLLPLFGLNFYIPLVHDFRSKSKLELTKNQLGLLIRVWGGEVFSRFGPFLRFSSTRKDKCVIIVPSSAKKLENILQKNDFMFSDHIFIKNDSIVNGDIEDGIKVTDYSWVVDSIASCSLLPIDDYSHGQVIESNC